MIYKDVIQSAVGVVLGVFLLSGCSFKAKTTPTPLTNTQAPTAYPESLKIGPNDWVTQTSSVGSVQATVRSVNADKLNFIQQNFQVPTLSSVTVPESNGFEIYNIGGYTDFEKTSYIYPKIFINTSSDHGSILGYLTGQKDGGGKDVIEISVPVAIVNGMVNALQTIGGSQSGTTSAVGLPSKFMIPDPNALQAKLGRQLDTLPVCPTLFKLTYQGKEYWAGSPYQYLSTCPLNTFFRIKFRAPVSDMKTILEAASFQDEAVAIVGELSAMFAVPKKAITLGIKPDDFKVALNDALKTIQPSGNTVSGDPAYAAASIEQAVIDALFHIAAKAGFDPQQGTNLPKLVDQIIFNYFDDPFTCPSLDMCRALKKQSLQKNTIFLNWQETVTLASDLNTETETGLGAVANSSPFLARPIQNQLNLVRKPTPYKTWTLSAIITDCVALSGTKYPNIYNLSADDQAYLVSYCDTVLANALSDPSDPQQADGYFPLGSNTTVYPGAWLKLDISNIQEFTTAKTRKDPNTGAIQIQSEVVNLLANQPAQNELTCVQGQETNVCQEWATKTVDVLDAHGDRLFVEVPCNKGDAGCNCTTPSPAPDATTPPAEVCTRKQYQTQEVRNYECAPGSQYDYCPYWVTRRVTINSEPITECHEEVVTTSLVWGIFGTSTDKTTKCTVTGHKDITEYRVFKNCKEDDPLGTALREHGCLNPQYLCKTWSKNCTKYSVNEAFQVVHEDIAGKWRPFDIEHGEYPKRFEEDIYLKFVSPNRISKECRLNQFARQFRGNSIFIKLPTEANEYTPALQTFF